MEKLSLEQEVKKVLKSRNVEFEDHSDSFKLPDFTLLMKGEPYFYLEVKEKRQKYKVKNWDISMDEAHLFILDDLTVRKMLAYAPLSGALVRDNMQGAYYFFSVVDLALMPKKRMNREIYRVKSALKGKWLVDLRNGKKASSLADAFSCLRAYVDALDEILFAQNECYGAYHGEDIQRGGVTRQAAHWVQDVKATR